MVRLVEKLVNRGGQPRPGRGFSRIPRVSLFLLLAQTKTTKVTRKVLKITLHRGRSVSFPGRKVEPLMVVC